MAKSKAHTRRRLKIIGYIAGSLIAAATLLILSRVTRPEETGGPEPAASTTAPTTAPSPDSTPGTPPPSRDRESAAAQSMSGMLLLFSAGAFLVGLICVGWLVYDIRSSRPAWKTQTKFPKHRKH